MYFFEKKLQNPCYVREKLYLCSVKIVTSVNDMILGYGVMVTQQILVLFFLVRIRVAQLQKASCFHGGGDKPGVWAMV